MQRLLHVFSIYPITRYLRRGLYRFSEYRNTAVCLNAYLLKQNDGIRGEIAEHGDLCMCRKSRLFMPSACDRRRDDGGAVRVAEVIGKNEHRTDTALLGANDGI